MFSSTQPNALTHLSASSATSHGGGYHWILLPDFRDHQFSFNTLVNPTTNNGVKINDHSSYRNDNAGNTSQLRIKKKPLLLSGRPEQTAAKKKDHRTKIMTAQGQRDRRVRLSISIAQKFFHLQDTLGFDKPSKTLSWLFAKSKLAIQELTHAAADSSPYSAVSDGVSTRKANKRGKDCSMKDVAAKESRAKARARARARTLKKMCMKEMSEANTFLPPALSLVKYPLDIDDVAAKVWDIPQHLRMPGDLSSADDDNVYYGSNN
ncbi:unnamed protein product [Cuscuta epithymum]|uniref:Uncharacterized protein n=1 Tax=Cuscuta epithymum TaxID=186058 RepID=A0AAV0D109_9ASTE|nr:unnamed protein product [Cuscuta epithymum]